MTRNILRIDSSARHKGSVSRDISDKIIAKMGDAHVVVRDLAKTPIPQVDEVWVGANFTAPDERSQEQTDKLAFSDALIAEIQAADTLVIGHPVYNFSTPGALKAWIDHVVRVGVTFRYTENGPEGLLTGKRAIVAFASGGTSIGSDIDFATGYLRFILGFIGITDVEFVTADDLADSKAA